jgi:lambda family phage portal protein
LRPLFFWLNMLGNYGFFSDGHVHLEVYVRPNILDRMLGFFSPQKALRRLEARTRLEFGAAAYRGAESNRLRSDWISYSTAAAQVSTGELLTLRQRSRSLNRNDPVAAGLTDTIGLNVVGRGLQVQARLRNDALGITPDQARELESQIETLWGAWAAAADSGNRMTFDELQFLALRKIVEDGEVLALPVMAGEAWRPVRRAVELSECDRLNMAQGMNGSGIDLGARGEPAYYHLLPADYSGSGMVSYGQSRKEAARDSQGRPRVLHLYRVQRPGQLRGVPLFSPVISYFQDLANYLEAELVAAKVAACLSVFVIKTDAYMGALSAATGTESSTGNRLQQLEPGMIPYLNLGEDIKVVDPKRTGETFGAFVEGVLRLIGAGLGLPYELVLKDFSKTNYSSARAALLEGRRMFGAWRAWFADRFCQPIYELVLEEAFLRGLLEMPRFYENKAEYCRCLWIGGAWGWVDPVKEVEASKMAVDFGLSTLAEEAAGQGRDWEEVLEQRAREDRRAKELGVTLAPVQKSPGGAAPGGEGV